MNKYTFFFIFILFQSINLFAANLNFGFISSDIQRDFDSREKSKDQVTNAKYQIIDLGLHKYTESKATCINNAGNICGYYIRGDQTYLFVINPDKKIYRKKANIKSSRIFINNHNQVFGSCIRNAEEHHFSYKWIFDTEVIFKWKNPFTKLKPFNFISLKQPKNQRSTPFIFRHNIVWHANDLGQLIVMNQLNFDDTYEELTRSKPLIWIYHKKKFQPIEHSKLEAAFKINNSSQILGCFHIGNTLDANRVSYTSIYNFNDHTVQVLDLPGSSWGTDMNDNGQVVGVFYHPFEQVIMGYLYNPSTEMIYLENFSPVAINNKDQIVGHIIYGNQQTKPALIDQGVIYDLSDLIYKVDDQGNIWDLNTVTDINDNGDIIGTGTLKGKKQPLLLKALY